MFRAMLVLMENMAIDGVLKANRILTKPISTPPGFVFSEDYALPELSEVKHFIDANKHLRAIPSGNSMESNCIEMIEMQMKLLQKIEELILYYIKQDERIKVLEKSFGLSLHCDSLPSFK